MSLSVSSKKIEELKKQYCESWFDSEKTETDFWIAEDAIIGQVVLLRISAF